MTKIVADTNVFVSSFLGGNPRRVVDLWTAGSIAPCLSPPIVDEYVRVLARMGLENDRELRELLDLLARGHHVLFTSSTPELHVVDSDPDDDKFVECAVALEAAFIVSGDRALGAGSEYMGIRIVGPGEFLALIQLRPAGAAPGRAPYRASPGAALTPPGGRP